jgi:hypothetical protein
MLEPDSVAGVYKEGVPHCYNVAIHILLLGNVTDYNIRNTVQVVNFYGTRRFIGMITQPRPLDPT